jgi:alkylhydroperoxidase family enzyme
MTLLKTIDKEEATGSVAAVYQMMEDRVKFIPNVVKLHSVSPEYFEKFMAITGFYTDHPTLDPVLVSYVRLLISNIEGANYCVRLQSAVLNNYKVEKEDILLACKDYKEINLDTKSKLLVCFVLDMMYDRLSNTRERIDELTAAGWTEKDIYEASMLAAVQKGATKVIKGFEVEFDF